MTWLRNPWGRPRWLALITGALHRSGRSCPSLIAIAVRLQRRPLADDLAGLLAPLVHGRDGQRPARPGAARRARAHAAARRDLRRRSRRRSASRSRSGCSAGAGAARGTVNIAHAAAARDARDRDGRRAAAALPAASSRASGSAPTAQAIGQVTFTLSYVVVIVRGRLVSIGPEYEEAAADLGAPPRDQLLPRAAAAARPGDRGQRRGRRSRSRSTTSSSPSTCRATRARRPSRCCSTRTRAARRRPR